MLRTHLLLELLLKDRPYALLPIALILVESMSLLFNGGLHYHLVVLDPFPVPVLLFLDLLKLLRPLNRLVNLLHSALLLVLQLFKSILHKLHVEVNLFLLYGHCEHLHSLVGLAVD